MIFCIRKIRIYLLITLNKWGKVNKTLQRTSRSYAALDASSSLAPSAEFSVSLPKNMMSIQSLEGRIREFINSARRQSVLLKTPDAWNMLCSSLDLIGDTQLAIDSYPQFHNIQADGASYLVVYGILQTLLLQQNATKHIGAALDIKVKLPKDLENIRVIRNSAAGHPTHQKENGLSKSCFITRMSISPTSFQLMTVYSGDKEYEFHQISIPSLIETQKKYLTEVLALVVTELERQEMEHRKTHKANKLADTFPHTISYHFSKIFEATHREDLFLLGTPNMKMIIDCMDNFKRELSDRGEWEVHDSIDYHYDLIEYPLKRLERYFEGNDNMNEKDAYIFASFLSDQVKSLEEIAKELDEKYESLP